MIHCLNNTPRPPQALYCAVVGGMGGFCSLSLIIFPMTLKSLMAFELASEINALELSSRFAAFFGLPGPRFRTASACAVIISTHFYFLRPCRVNLRDPVRRPVLNNTLPGYAGNRFKRVISQHLRSDRAATLLSSFSRIQSMPQDPESAQALPAISPRSLPRPWNQAAKTGLCRICRW